jgi:hypothetical protein
MKYLITIILSIGSLITTAQSPSYQTRKIANWTLEDFPTAYFVKPHHISVTRNRDGKLISYQELDAYGNPNGISVELQDNLIYPYLINYYCKGTIVYSATYFANSNKADLIQNWNLKNVLDGPQITRTLKDDNTIAVKTIVYKNGKDVKEKEPQINISYSSDGYLNGNFVVEDNGFRPELYMIYKGKADNGYLEYIEEKDKEGNGVSYEINGYCVLFKSFKSNGIDTFKIFGRLKERFQIVNPEVTLKNYKGLFQIRSWGYGSDDIALLKQELYPQILSDEEREHFEFNNNLLTGKFSSKFFCNADVTGVAQNGVIQEMFITYVTGYYKKIIKNGNKYTIQKLDQNQNILKAVEFEITHPVLLVNDDNLNKQNLGGGEIYVVKKGFNIWEPIFKMIGHSDEIKGL